MPAPKRLPVILTVLPLVVLLSACSRGQAMPQAAVPEVGVVVLADAPVTDSDVLTGRVNATMSADVRPQVDGVVQARLFTEGSVVTAGSPLYQIQDTVYAATLASAQAQLENAKALLSSAQAKADRYKTLSDNEAVSKQDIDDANAAAQAALANVHLSQAAVDTARANLTFTRVLAPISGRIGRSSVTQGALVTANQATALATIQQLDPVYVDITESSSQLRQARQALAEGDVLPTSASVRLKFEDGTDYAAAGTLEFSEATVDPSTDTVTLRARFPNPQGVLLPGMFVRVDMPRGVVPNGLLAPQQGIVRDPKGGAIALIVAPGNKVVARSVTADRAIGNTWLITAGLHPGDRLIVEGVDQVKAGDVARPVLVKLGY